MSLKVPSILIFLAMAAIQASLGDLVCVYGIKPSFIFIVVYALSVTGGEWKGLLYGCMGGVMEDCLSGGYSGLFMSAYAISGFLAGKAGKKLFNVGESANFAGIFILSFISSIYVILIMHNLQGGSGIVSGALRFALPQALYNAVAGAFFLWVFKEQLSRRVPWLKVIRQLQVRF
jgi:rod shape-determining protein MreD